MSVKIFTKKITSWESLPVLLDIETVCCLLQCSENTAIKLCKNGEIKGKKTRRNVASKQRQSARFLYELKEIKNDYQHNT